MQVSSTCFASRFKIGTDGEDSPEDGTTDSSSHPVDVREGAPGEDEETDLSKGKEKSRSRQNGKGGKRRKTRRRTHGKSDRSDHHRRKTSFRRSVGLSSGNVEVVLSVEVLRGRTKGERTTSQSRNSRPNFFSRYHETM